MLERPWKDVCVCGWMGGRVGGWGGWVVGAEWASGWVVERVGGPVGGIMCVCVCVWR